MISKIQSSCITILYLIAALLRIHYHYFSTHAFVPQTIITRKSTTTSPSIKTTIIIPNKPVNNHHYSNDKIMQSQNRYVVMKQNVAGATDTTSDEELEKEIQSMKAKDIRQELESYGISTKSFFEKSELVGALVNARKEGMTPLVVNGESGSSASSSAFSDATSSSRSSATSGGGGGSRQERINQEMDKCSSMKVADLKKELESYGISTKSFFEKSEFVRAVAEARVDGVKKSSPGSGSSSSTSGSSSSSNRAKEETRDPSFRDVVVTKFTGDKARLLGGKIIDVRAR